MTPVTMINAGIAQSVEQLIRNQQVACSSHVSSSNPRQKFLTGILFCPRRLFYRKKLATIKAIKPVGAGKETDYEKCAE